ncbi:hypothetical protein SUGI_0726580 [Cryptomeria japonica]|nr:hypothetical protein SUGI_0726580 [Cryptomeria japonica]
MDPVVERQVKYEEENKSGIKSMVHVFQVPLHYPRYTKADYESMPESKLDTLLAEYGLKAGGDVSAKRKYAMGAFLWPAELR